MEKNMVEKDNTYLTDRTEGSYSNFGYLGASSYSGINHLVYLKFVLAEKVKSNLEAASLEP